MCGITGYVGSLPAVSTAISNLKRLEYRGYDSAGVAFISTGGLSVIRAEGRIVNLETVLQTQTAPASIAIAHTRWATHGVPCEANSHPHRDCAGDIAVVHNGIIENYAQLRAELIARGHSFTSDTDTETLAHLIEEQLRLTSPGNFVLAVRNALKLVHGSYAVAVLWAGMPDSMVVARHDSPLIIGAGESEMLIASDITAVMKYTRDVIVLEDGDCALINAAGAIICNLNGDKVERNHLIVDWDDTAAEKGGHAHFMLKEIFEGPRTVRETLRGRLTPAGTVDLNDLGLSHDRIASINRICLVGCGTAYHAGVVARRLFEQLIRHPIEVHVASEYRYSDPILDKNTLVVLISQSGETADTMAALRLARSNNALTLGVVNVVGSSLAREADARLITQAGPEIGVASTKAYLAQLTALTLLGLYLAEQLAPQTAADQTAITQALTRLPEWLDECVALAPRMEALSAIVAESSGVFFLGRGYDYATALEAALKLKEISYLYAEAYPAGEMKHGPLALVEPGVTVIGLCTQSTTYEKMLSNLKEVSARSGAVVALIPRGKVAPENAEVTIELPACPDALMPMLTIVPLQLLAYYVALMRGCPIDQPRNLAKSVTVE